MNSMDEKVLSFLKEWLAWAEAGGPEHEAFKLHYGLCHNAKRFRGVAFARHFLLSHLGGDAAPFGAASFVDRAVAKTQHECPKRLAWVRAKIAELEA